VVVDGSKASLDAAEEAIDLAQKYSADLIALCVIPSDITGDSITPELRRSLERNRVYSHGKGSKTH